MIIEINIKITILTTNLHFNGNLILATNFTTKWLTFLFIYPQLEILIYTKLFFPEIWSTHKNSTCLFSQNMKTYVYKNKTLSKYHLKIITSSRSNLPVCLLPYEKESSTNFNVCSLTGQGIKNMIYCAAG